MTNGGGGEDYVMREGRGAGWRMCLVWGGESLIRKRVPVLRQARLGRPDGPNRVKDATKFDSAAFGSR